eukprot:CAMPEP_0175232552 /NCGR_PEP_ID=MMETSP0093-20121207/26019_1 /TAXON_ID=311494 /ORGANISM="Alexandrium monilatum, Strain CCMP3105" /LENGTH=121 /DNA_ID=CAMNT_0016526415 /DNA_START=190 /DNA_END=553 /DNA_ORIENTATION=-
MPAPLGETTLAKSERQLLALASDVVTAAGRNQSVVDAAHPAAPLANPTAPRGLGPAQRLVREGRAGPLVVVALIAARSIREIDLASKVLGSGFALVPVFDVQIPSAALADVNVAPRRARPS